MKSVSTISLRWIILASLCLLAAAGCSRSEKSGEEIPRTEIEAKLNGVLNRMVSRCEDQQEIEQLKAAQLFHNLKGMPMDIVGFSVPIGTNHVFVSFTLEHFRKTTLDVLASEALENLHLAKATKPPSR
jgi:hypothetical protein